MPQLVRFGKLGSPSSASLSSGPAIPAGALKDRDGNFILDRDGNYIISGER